MILKSAVITAKLLFSWETLAIALLKAVSFFLKGWLKDERLSSKQIMLTQSIDVLNKTLGKRWATETACPIDDVFVEENDALVEEIAKHHGFGRYELVENAS